jgi:hypothetical protein
MSLEQNLLLLLWVAGLALTIFTVSGDKWHQWAVAFLACQAFAWLAEILIVKLDLVAYPVREFPKASDLSLTLEIMLVPVCAALYVIHEPSSSWMARFRHWAIWTCSAAVIDKAVAHYTRLQDHSGFHWWMTVVLFGSKFLAVNLFVRWFFRNPMLFKEERNSV